METTIDFSAFPTYKFMPIEPTNKKEVKRLNGYRLKLGITEPQEDFVLKCILNFEKRQDCVLIAIEKIKKSKSLDMVDFVVRTKLPPSTINYCVSNPLREEGWILKTHIERCWSVYRSLNKYITTY